MGTSKHLREFSYFPSFLDNRNLGLFIYVKQTLSTKNKHVPIKQNANFVFRKIFLLGWLSSVWIILSHLDTLFFFFFKEYFNLVWFYGISTIVGYLIIPNPFYTYIWFSLVGFYGISTIVGYLMPNPLYTSIKNIYDLVWLGFMAYQPL